MRNFEIRNILMGIGMGIILTAIMGMIFTAGDKKITKEEIITKAKAYGMIESEKLIIDGK